MGYPEDIVSDRDAQFLTAFWRHMMRRSGTKVILTTAFHLQGDGQTKRVNATLNMYLRNYIAADHRDWMDILPQAEFCYNTTFSTSIGMSPFKVAHGFDALKPTNLVLAKKDEDSPSTYFSKLATELVSKRECVRKMARYFLKRAQTKYKKVANKHCREVIHAVGDQVWLDTTNLSIPNSLSHKWVQRWAGPYKVLKVIHKDVYFIDVPKKGRFHPIFHVSVLKKFIPDE